MWSEDTFSFAGKHYSIKDVPKACTLRAGERPQILVGGGGKRLLSVAGRYADIVGINPSLPEGKVTATTPADQLPSACARRSPGCAPPPRRPAAIPNAIELQALSFVLAITDTPGASARSARAIERHDGGAGRRLSALPDRLGREIQDRLAKRREQTGISYVVIQGAEMEQVERFAAEVMAPLGQRLRTRARAERLQLAERAREDVARAVAERIDAAAESSGSTAATGETRTNAAPPAASDTKPIGRITSRSAAIASGPQTPPGRCTAAIGSPVVA